MNQIKYNSNTKLVIADVDETIADVYTDATPEMINELNKILSNGTVLFLVSGGGLQSIRERVTDKLDAKLRHKVLIAHCSGAEVWGFDDTGNINEKPYYGVYDEKMTEVQKLRWREIVNGIVTKHNLKVFPAMPKPKFKDITNGDRLSVMLVDRGPQITFECPNDESLRSVILADLELIYKAENFPAHAKLAGVFAVDNILEGVNKTFAINNVLSNNELMAKLNLPLDILDNPESIEIWGDKFHEVGGSDFLMSKAVPAEVRSIDFRDEPTEGFAKGYNIVVWQGAKHLHEGLLEYLQSV